MTVWGSDFKVCKQKEGSAVLEHISLSTSCPIDCVGLLHRIIASKREMNKDEEQKEGTICFILVYYYYQFVGLVFLSECRV